MTTTPEQGFQTKFNEPLPNTMVEHLAQTLCLQSKVFIRDISDFSKVPLDAQHQFREFACELAEILGVDGFNGGNMGLNVDHSKLLDAAMHFVAKVEGRAEGGRVASSVESYGQFMSAMGLVALSQYG